ncbi:ABC transporter ATP-binding protein [Rhodococcus sp. Leaf7]|uniref:zinc ABC transporter ATP-binding protein AztA n=1 Tax=unclassified Rhodococcus (in: high G+C Gram-positive bacteria) TaxID=192944 RepID=UPI0006FFB2FF|nr:MULTISPECIES: zinc ABC transporter ATP-binding protein AztA [unclassified Rhodococcus (in: high G+C Gram-positive bacteria)]KQU07034.1 ABC transporter ATP-binding protein [Rhodococcus sp. Leaf7]KQU42552.1 ABC transporter ATP-binding protein [Rhodococcus sp. Leaf247]
MFTSRSEQSPAARLRGVRVEYPTRVAVRDVDLDVSRGAIMAIAGPNGAGKSTLLEVIAGTTSLTSGSRVATQRIAFVPQRAAVSDRLPLTVRDVVTVGAWGRTGRWRRLDSGSRASVNDALDRLGITELAAVPFSTLSGGQRQRALLAQGLAGQADLLLLDEPTTGLDTASGERIRAVMRAESQRGAAVVCVSHDPSVLGTADRVVTLEDGRIVS